MAKPDCDDGWLRYAHELDAALAVADFTKGARIVLREVFSQVFGPAKLKTATLSPTEIGALSGVAKSNIARAVKELMDASVLDRLNDGSYRFNKNYESWVSWGRKDRPKGVPLLSPVEVSYCRSSPARAVAFRASGIIESTTATAPEMAPNSVIPRDNPSTDAALSNGITDNCQNVIPRDNPSTCVPSLGVIPWDNKTLSRGITNGHCIPISEDSKKLASKPLGAHEGEASSHEYGSHQECVDFIVGIWGDKTVNVLTARKDSIARQLDGSPDPAGGPASPRWDCLLAAMKEMERRRRRDGFKSPDDPIAYAVSIAQTYAVEGIPPEPEPLTAAIPAVPARPETKRFKAPLPD